MIKRVMLRKVKEALQVGGGGSPRIWHSFMKVTSVLF